MYAYILYIIQLEGIPIERKITNIIADDSYYMRDFLIF